MASNKYGNGKIYKVVDLNYTMCYYGSTIEPLCKRIGKHRFNYSKYKKHELPYTAVYTIFDAFGVSSCKIELVEDFPCNSVEELRRKEGEYIKNNACVNKAIPGRSFKEWRQDNAERMREHHKKWREKHKEELPLMWRKAYEKHRDSHLQNKREYYLANKDAIMARQKEQHICNICGGRYQRNDRAKHFRAQKHRLASMILKLKEVGNTIQELMCFLCEREVGLLNAFDDD